MTQLCDSMFGPGQSDASCSARRRCSGRLQLRVHLLGSACGTSPKSRLCSRHASESEFTQVDQYHW